MSNSELLDALDRKQISPSKIIGGGYKSSAIARKLAREYLLEQIAKESGAQVLKEYIVIVKLGEEAIHLEADSKDYAIERAKDIIAEQYSYDLSRSSTISYEVEGEGK
jgi:hypothetical protein